MKPGQCFCVKVNHLDFVFLNFHISHKSWVSLKNEIKFLISISVSIFFLVLNKSITVFQKKEAALLKRKQTRLLRKNRSLNKGRKGRSKKEDLRNMIGRSKKYDNNNVFSDISSLTTDIVKITFLYWINRNTDPTVKI